MTTRMHRRTVLIPRMSDHALVAGAAMRAQGITAEVLPLPDDDSFQLGVRHCAGRECSPCFACMGDILRRARTPGFGLSDLVTLDPGDIIATGTPGGSKGALKAGDNVEVEITNIGILSNIIAEREN